MAMQNSEELADVAFVLFEQLRGLGGNLWGTGFGLCEKDSDKDSFWFANENGVFPSVSIPNTTDPAHQQMFEGWKSGLDFLSIEASGEDLQNHYDYMLSLPEVKPFFQKILDEGLSFPEWQQWNTAYFKHGYLLVITLEPYTDQDILVRFAKVFDQTYTRFLDLQKAEAQARESEIELALERVRARTMAMQHSDELADASLLLDEQVRGLGIKTRGCAFNIYGEKESTEWFSSEMGTMPTYKTPRETVFLDYYEAGQKGETFLTREFAGKECAEWYNYLCTLPVMGDGLKQMIAAGGSFPTRQIDHVSFFKYGYLLFITFEPVPEAHEIFKRFAKVFEQTYTRFLDLRKAEAQAREAQIEMALEKVRSRSMGMQKSDELKEVIQVVYDQFIQLNIAIEHTGFIMDYNTRDDMHIWLADQHEVPSELFLPYFDSSHWNSFNEAKENGTDFFPTLLDFKEKNKFYKKLFSLIPEVPEETKEYYLTCPGLAGSTVLMDTVSLYIENFQGIPFTDEENKILMRFGKVFQQTYTRFLDLQKAEAQAREAKLESALEKVRNVALGLQKSEDMLEIAQVLYEQLRELGFDDIRNALIDIDNGGDGTFTDYDYSEEMSGTVTQMTYKDDPTLEEQFQKMISKTDDFFEILLKGKKLQDLIDMRRANGEAEDPRLLRIDEVSYNMYSFGNGSIGISNFGPLDDEHKEMLGRFRNVFTFAYKRYSDLAQAEAQARKALIEMSLERVRSRTMAMQKSDELAETSVVVFQQLINLGIAPNRLFIGIINKETKALEAWATNEDGTKIGNQFTLNADRNASVKKMYEGWKQKKTSITIDMKGKELQNYFHYLADEMKIPFKGGLSQKRRVQTIAYFGQGLIGMASPEEQPAETTQLLERFAAVFNLTYTRFNDLKIAEANTIQAEKDLIKLQIAKQEAENALTELKSAQSQLIQAEKMASLGELTAGIAHEIQNPLNFVNNFAELSNELMDEMNEELAKGDLDEAKSISNNIKQNLEKINHHGKRADAIVKGMLQHSRTKTGAKEPTDINALADEYLRLAYHGLRAKDKSFNSDIKTDFDESLGKINVIPQDIGRVLLNLFNNGFYAVSERSRSEVDERHAAPTLKGDKTGKTNYQPIVSVSTLRVVSPFDHLGIRTEGVGGGGTAINSHIEIHVSDNGNGIPQNIVDKIFQPFFTTKPTGQGTGLGLSLSYDIVKAHGGELKVETKQGEGTTFIITIPTV